MEHEGDAVLADPRSKLAESKKRGQYLSPN